MGGGWRLRLVRGRGLTRVGGSCSCHSVLGSSAWQQRQQPRAVACMLLGDRQLFSGVVSCEDQRWREARGIRARYHPLFDPAGDATHGARMVYDVLSDGSKQHAQALVLAIYTLPGSAEVCAPGAAQNCSRSQSAGADSATCVGPCACELSLPWNVTRHAEPTQSPIPPRRSFLSTNTCWAQPTCRSARTGPASSRCPAWPVSAAPACCLAPPELLTPRAAGCRRRRCGHRSWCSRWAPGTAP